MARYPTRFQIRTLWNAATGVSILVLGALIVGLVWLIGQVFGFLQPVLVPLAVSAIVAYLLDPVVRIFQKRGFSRRWAVVSVFAGFTLMVGGLVAIMIPLIGGQIHKFQEQREAVAASRQSAQTEAERAAIAENPAAAKKPFDEIIVDILIDTRKKNEWAKPFIDPLLAPPGANDAATPAPGSSVEAPGTPTAPKASITPSLDDESYRPALQETELWVQAKGYLDEIFGWVKGGAGKVLGFLGLALG
ncbi:MAG TPA: AI-2E family transporter, partial [Haloferula sp.]